MADVLVDTDVFIDVLRGVQRLRRGGEHFAYSLITRCELFAGRNTDEDGLRRLLGAFEELAVDRAIAETAGRIRRSSGIATPDALIAASALANDLSLMTRNRRHFERVDGLYIRAPAWA